MGFDMAAFGSYEVLVSRAASPCLAGTQGRLIWLLPHPPGSEALS